MKSVCVASAVPGPAVSRLQSSAGGLGAISEGGVTMTMAVFCHQTHPHSSFISTRNTELQSVSGALQHWSPGEKQEIHRDTNQIVYNTFNL